MFGQHYIKGGSFSVDDARLYSQLETLREKSDYNCVYQTTEEEMRPLIERAERFIEKVKIKLKK